MRKLLSTLLFAAMILTLAACGNSNPPAVPAASTPPSPALPAPSSEPTSGSEVDSIDFASSKGRLVYKDYEYANADFYNSGTPGDAAKTIILNFDFTNKAEKPSGVQFAFKISVYQNGVEIKSPTAWSGAGSTEAMDNFYNGSAMKDATITVGSPYILKDYSPLSIMVESYETMEYQIMELPIEAPEEPASQSDVDAESVEAALQGAWNINGGTFTFNAGSLAISSDGQVLTGTYEINTADRQIEAILSAADGSVKIKLPFAYEDDRLTLYNNRGDAAERE